MTTDRIHGANEWEQHWHAYDQATRLNPAHRYRRALIFSALDRSRLRPTSILDVGCGQGDFLAEARSRFATAALAGIDFSGAGIELSRKRVPDATLLRADFESSDPLPSELSGIATHLVCSEVLEHLDRPEVLLHKLSSALKPSGELIVTVPGGPRSAFDIHIGHRRHYSPAELTELLAAAGFEAIQVAGAGFPFFNVYKLLVILRGRRLVEDIDQTRPFSRASVIAMSLFNRLFAANTARGSLGWQTFGIFRLR